MNDDLFMEFAAEAADHLQIIMNWLVEVSTGGGDDGREAVRSAHSIKGAARMVGALDVAELAKNLEMKLRDLADAEEPSQDTIDEALTLCSELTAAVEVTSEDDINFPEETPAQPEFNDLHLQSVREAFPLLERSVIEGLSEFACEEVGRLLREGKQFWLIRVGMTGDTFETVTDAANNHFRKCGDVISQTIGISTEPDTDYIATYLYAADGEPSAAPDDTFSYTLTQLEIATIPEPLESVLDTEYVPQTPEPAPEESIEPVEEPPMQLDMHLQSVRDAFPQLEISVIEGLSEFACEEVGRLLREGKKFWLIRVNLTTDTFETVTDSANTHFRSSGDVVSQTIGVSTEPDVDYTATYLYAAEEEPPSPTDNAFVFTCSEIEIGTIPEPLESVLDTEYTPGKTEKPVEEEQPAEEPEPPPQEEESGGGMELMEEQLQEMFLETSDNLIEEMTSAISGAEDDPDSSEALDALFRAGHSLKGAGGSFGFPIISRLGHQMEQVLEKVRRRQLPLSQDLLDVLYECVDIVSEICQEARQGVLDQNKELPILEQLKLIGEGKALSEMPAPAQKAEPSAKKQEPAEEKAAPAQPAAAKPKKRTSVGQTMRLSLEAADRLLDLGRDSWIALETAAFLSPPEGDVRDAVERARTSMLSLVDAILDTRMQPVGHILQAFPRLARDVSRKHGKQIKLEITGEEVRMDRLMLEAMNDPLVHIVRNALDHGVEDPETRQSQGKPSEGTVLIDCVADKDSVTIQVSDDGKGIDSQRLRAKAVKMGRLTQEAADSMTETQALDLIFMPGLSSKEQVTDLSGRGVGMDVVRANVEQVRGSVEIQSTPGKGTSIQLRLPLTAAMLRVVMVEIMGSTVCVPTTAVDRIVSVKQGETSVMLTNPEGEQELVPLVPASRYIQEGQDIVGTEAVVIRDHRLALGLLVGNVADERPVLMTDLGRLVPRTQWVGACTLLANGQVAPILDTNAIIQDYLSPGGAQIEAEPEPEAAQTTGSGLPQILAVDDSPTMRQLLRNVLELAGYSVNLANDGPGALKELSKSTPDLILTDVNMPGMDGFTLVREIRKRKSTTPVAIVSGRDNESDRKAGIEAGADAYIVKGAADRRGLLSTVARLLSKSTTS